MKPLRTLATVVAVLLLSASARAADYTIDPGHTDAEFTVTHLAVSKVHGTIPMTAGALTLGSNDLPTAGTATFDVKSLSSGNDRRDADLRSPNFFDVDKYPTMTFVVRSAAGTPQAFTVTGDLTIHGVTKSVTLKGSETGTATVRGKRHVGYSATTTIDRRDYGLTWGNVMGGELIAGYEVGIAIDLDAVEK